MSHLYPFVGIAVPLLAVAYQRWSRARIERELPQLEQLTATRQSAARAFVGMAVAFLTLALAGALLYGDEPGPWITVIVYAGIALWCASKARWWQRKAGGII